MEDNTDKTPTGTSSTGSKKQITIIGLIAAAIVALITAIAFWLFGNNDANPLGINTPVNSVYSYIIVK